MEPATKICCAWKDIDYYCIAEAFDYRLSFTVYRMYTYQDPGTDLWDGIAPFAPDKAPPGYAFNKKDSDWSPDPVYTVQEADVFMHGTIKWDGCSDIHFDEQDRVMLHFCGRHNAESIGVLMGRLHDLAQKHCSSYDVTIAT